MAAAGRLSAADFSLAFDGVNDYVRVASAPELTLSNRFTIEFWFKPSPTPQLNKYVLSRNGINASGQSAVIYGYTANALEFFALGYTGADPRPGSSIIINDTQWHHVAYTYNGTTWAGFLDGVNVFAANHNFSLNTSSNDWFLGCASPGLNHVAGTLDEVRIWNVGRSKDEIQEDMNRRLPLARPGLVAYYRMDEGTGVSTADNSAHGFSGALVNGPQWVASDTPMAPDAETLSATGASFTSATFRGTVNPLGRPASAWFEWGLSTNLGNTTSTTNVGNGSQDTDVSATVNILAEGQTHYFRVVATNVYGRQYGAIQSVTPPARFTNVNAGLPLFNSGSAKWGDYDNDGRLDILCAGFVSSGPSNGDSIAQVWRNTPDGFVNINAGLPGVANSSVAWGDYDNDGRLDILFTGSTDSERISQVWRNTPGGFVNINAALPGVSRGSVAWGDYNNDGRLDILLTGFTDAGRISQVWRNEPGGFVNINAGLPGIERGSAAWGDYDNDGRLDIVLTGSNNLTRISQVWRNTSAGFVNINAGLPGVWQSSVAWGDYDNDGRLDMLLTGDNGFNRIAQVRRNTPGGFVDINAGLPGVFDGAAAWGDYDNDGRLDILLTGLTTSGFVSQVWRNTPSGFVNINASLPGVFDGTAAWGDYDDDGRLDILLIGETGTIPISQVWRNNLPATNTPPLPPGALTVNATGPSIVLQWSEASDGQTATPGLTYNLRVGTTPGGTDIVSPMAASTGQRLLPQMGNVQRGTSTALIPNVGNFYWSVQTIDSAFAGSTFAPEQSFTVGSVLTPTNGIPIPGDINGDGKVDDGELSQVLSHYWPHSPFLQMTNVAGLGGTNVIFAITNAVAGDFGVEVTTNLVNWQSLGPATPRYSFTDTNAPGASNRFYRLRWP